MQQERRWQTYKAVKQKLAELGFDTAALRLRLAFKYNPDWHLQPRVPRGNPDGGRWTDGGGGTQVANVGAAILPVLREGGRQALKVASTRARPYLMRMPKYWLLGDLFPAEDEFDFETQRIGLPSNRRPETKFIWYKSFDEAKKYLGPAGAGMEWHHIVEQRTAEYGLFPINLVNSTDNLVALPEEVHACITSKMKRRFLGVGRSTRYVIEPQPFEVQFNFGIDLIKICLREYGYDPENY